MGKNKLLQMSGFTLFEVLIALSLAGLVIGVLAESFNHSRFMQQHLEGRITALVLGEGKLAELAQDSEPASSGEFARPYNDFKWVAQEESAENGTKVIKLMVEWHRGQAAPERLSFTGYRNPE